MKFIVIAALLLTSFTTIAASGIPNTTIVNLHLDRERKQVLIRTAVSPVNQQNRIACHTGNGWNYVLPLENPIDQAIYSALLAAYTSQKPMHLGGNGLCPASGQNNVEVLLNITPLTL
jgi:hypothetical protein